MGLYVYKKFIERFKKKKSRDSFWGKEMSGWG